MHLPRIHFSTLLEQLWGVSLPEDGVDGATGIGSGTRRKMILTIEDAKTDGLKKSVIDTFYLYHLVRLFRIKIDCRREDHAIRRQFKGS